MKENHPTRDDILSTEFSFDFTDKMENRMVLSFFKYGYIKDAYPHKVNAIESALARIKKYQETGNGEWLVDAANFLMIETKHPLHPNYHFRGTDSDESIGRETHDPDMSGRQTKNKDLLSQDQVKEFGQ